MSDMPPENANVIVSDATLGYADTVVDYFNAGTGPITDAPYGGTYNEATLQGTFPVEVSLSVVLGDEPFSDGTVDFLSLPEGSYVTVGFSDEVIVDGDGDDIFVTEIAGLGELAEVYVGSGDGSFELLGTASGGETASFDLADIGFTGFVSEVKIVGLNNAGGSPGYDVVNVRALTAGLVDLSEDNDLTGTDGDDYIELQDGDDRFEGSGGNDEAHGDDGNDELLGQQGKDTLKGGAGKDTLKGGKNRDELAGGKGKDKLDGGQGKDQLNGGKGDDKLTGGEDDDTFVFSEGQDLIKDFDVAGGDLVDLSKFDTFKGFNDLRNNHMMQAGDDVVIDDLDGNVTTLRDVTMDDLGKSDFLFA